jgi:dienelactone hydrolase
MHRVHSVFSSRALRAASTMLSLLFIACAHGAQSPATPSAPAEVNAVQAVTTKEVDYSDGTTTLKGFIAYPAASEPRPAILVVHEWWGLNDYVRMRAQKLAEMGYVAMAVDMYGEGKQATHPEDATKFMTEVMSNMETGVKRFQAARKVLASDPRVDADRIAAIGYCMGGAIVLNMARNGEDLDLVASFHGNLATKTPLQEGKFKGKIFVATGAADPFVPPEQVAALRKELDDAKADYELVEYAGAVHAFTNPAADQAKAKFNLPLAYDAKADADSWQKLTDKLNEVWGKPGGT